MTKSTANGAAHDPVIHLSDSDADPAVSEGAVATRLSKAEQRARRDAEREQAEDLVERMTTKREKAAQHLADAEAALAEAEAQLKGDD
jgi:hypothetical protein